MLRWAVLGCLVLALAGCGIGKKDKGNTVKPGEGGSPGQSSPTYEWKRPSADSPRPTKTEKADSF